MSPRCLHPRGVDDDGRNERNIGHTGDHNAKSHGLAVQGNVDYIAVPVAGWVPTCHEPSLDTRAHSAMPMGVEGTRLRSAKKQKAIYGETH